MEMGCREANGSSTLGDWSRVLLMGIALMLISVIPFSTQASAAPKDDPICTSNAPKFDQASATDSNSTILGASISHLGQDVEVFKGSHHAATLQATGVEVRDHLGSLQAKGKFVIVCFTLRPHSSSETNFSLAQFVLGYGNGTDELAPNQDATVYGVEHLMGYKDISMVKSARPTISIARKKRTKLAAVFDVPAQWPDTSSLYLSVSGRTGASPAKKEFAVLLSDATTAADGSSGGQAQPAAPTDVPTPTATADPLAEYAPLADVRELAIRTGGMIGQKIVFSGSILSIYVGQARLLSMGDVDPKPYAAALQVTVMAPDGSTEVVVVGYNGDTAGMFEGSFVTVYATVGDTFTGTNRFGASITQPLAAAASVVLQ